MRRTFLILLALLVCPAGRADIIDLNYVDAEQRVAFPGVEEYPDHVFLLRVRVAVAESSDIPGHPNFKSVERVIPIDGPEPLTLMKTSYRMTVLAVPRRTFEELDEDARADITANTPGVLSCELTPPRWSRHVDAPEPGVARHRITIVEGKLAAEGIAAEPGDTDSSATGRPGRRSRAAWGMALAASFTWLGITLGRRLRPAAR